MTAEFVNTRETGLDLNKYIYLHCRCEQPLEFAWRFPRTNRDVSFICPKCKMEIRGFFGTVDDYRKFLRK